MRKIMSKIRSMTMGLIAELKREGLFDSPADVSLLIIGAAIMLSPIFFFVMAIINYIHHDAASWIVFAVLGVYFTLGDIRVIRKSAK